MCMSLVRLALASMFLHLITGLKVFRTPKGPGFPEATREAACNECKKYKDYLDKTQDCSCHATDVMGTFANDATRELTTRTEYGFETENTGKARLAEGWLWHCRPISDTPNLWQQCPV